MRSINRDWREVDKSTDVLSFPVLEVTDFASSLTI